MSLGDIAHLLEAGYTNSVSDYLAAVLAQEREGIIVPDEAGLTTWLGNVGRRFPEENSVLRQLFTVKHIRNRHARPVPMPRDTFTELCNEVLQEEEPPEALLWRVLDLKSKVRSWARRFSAQPETKE